ncbi:MAG: DUF4410 domain-containing protein [Dokdonella sp.]
MSQSPKLLVRTIILIAAAVFTAGCASSPPAAKFSQRAAAGSVVKAADRAEIGVTSAAGVAIADYEKARVVARIKLQLASKQALNEAATPIDYQVDVKITRYEKGNAFARAMLAGLGQIHLDGEVEVYAMPARERVMAFTVQKTFAWGGVYGGTTTMEDVEQSFAEGVANALTGQGDKQSGRVATTATSSR